MIRMLILSPFSYEYNNVNKYVNAGESLFFNDSSDSELEELFFLLSPDRPFYSWVYVEKEDLESLAKMKTIASNVGVEPTVINTITYEAEKEEIPQVPVQDTEEREARVKELDSLHYTKLATLLKEYKLGEYSSYANKDEVIEEIIKYEFE